MIERPSAKDILAESLLQLVKKTPINKVTIDMIVSNCGYSKKTFYNNFRDKYDLAYWIFEARSNQIISEYIDFESWGSVLGRIYRFMYENRNLFGNSWNSDDLVLHVRRIIDYVDNYYLEKLAAIHGEDVLTPKIRFLLKFNGYGATHMVIDWITHNWKQTPEEMGRYMADAIPEELAALLQLD